MVVCSLIVFDPAPASAATFVNHTPILLNTVAAPPGPYPSRIVVSNLAGVITNVTVTLTNLTHQRPDDIDVLLVGPGGQRVLLMSDAGGDIAPNFVTLTFSDDVTPFLSDNGALVTGTYRPSNYGAGDVFPAPAPAGPYANTFSVFDGTNPNGTWSLYAADDIITSSSGTISGGWELKLTVASFPPVIVKQPQDLVVQPGGTAVFDVDVTGTPPFGYQWLRNGQVFIPFGQGGGRRLTLPNITPNDAGFYAVVITNAANRNGVISRQARLDVAGPLEITETPRGVITGPGEDVVLRVRASGTPPIRFQWTLNGMVMTNETNTTLTLPKVDAGSGGNYQVVVWNGGEAITTIPALVLVKDSNFPPPNDRFSERPTVEGLRGVMQGDSSDARTERGEPVLPGGGKTVWFQWQAPDSGIVTLSSRGSTFDTLLSVFTGKEIADLQFVTQDDDRAGFYTSEFQFNAVRGELYQIQLDGFGRNGAGGEFTIRWNLERTQEIVPVIVTNPAPQAVKVDGEAIFKVLVDAPDVQYQWFFNGQPIRGAVENIFVVRRATRREVGFYSVRILNRFGRFVFSPAVVLQLGSIGFPFTGDKFETVLYSFSGGAPNAGYFSIGLGNSFFNNVPSTADRQADDPNPCGSPFFGTLWQGLTATNNGIIQVATTGSDIPARLAVYRLTGGIDDFLVPPIICDLTSASNGLPAIAQFNATNGTNYAVVVEGVGGGGNLQVNSVMGFAPLLNNPIKNCFVSEGGSIVLTMPADTWVPVPDCQWRFNGIDIPGATGTTLTVSSFSALKAGIYSVRMSNFVRTQTRDVANLILVGPFTLNHWWYTNAGQVSFVVNASNSTPFVLETTTNLNTPWLPVATNLDACLILLYTNSGALADPQRFFRAAPWPPAGP